MFCPPVAGGYQICLFEGALVYLEDGDSSGGGGGSEVDVNSLTIESKNMHEYFRVDLAIIWRK